MACYVTYRRSRHDSSGVTTVFHCCKPEPTCCNCRQPAKLQCDFETHDVFEGQTCDRWICEKCASTPVNTKERRVDYCPMHARQMRSILAQAQEVTR